MSTPDPFITRLEPLRPRGLHVIVHLDRGEPLEVVLEALERCRLGVGDALSRAQRRLLLDADADIRVRDAALTLISYRARTRAELRRRLRSRGFDPVRIERCLDRLGQRGLIDDAAVAAAFVRDRLRHRPRGRARLRAELRAKGVAAHVADRVIEEVFATEGVSEAALVRDVVAGWLARQGPAVAEALAETDRSVAREKARRRLHGYLARRGFRGEAAAAGFDRAVGLARGEV